MEFLMHGVTLWERITYGSNSSWKERPTGKRVIDEERTDGDSCLKWYAGNPLSSHTHPVGDTREETVGNDRGGLRPVSPTGVEWVGSGTRPISSHSSRFLVSSLVTVFHLLRLVRVKWSGERNRRRTTRDSERRWEAWGTGFVRFRLSSVAVHRPFPYLTRPFLIPSRRVPPPPAYRRPDGWDGKGMR